MSGLWVGLVDFSCCPWQSCHFKTIFSFNRFAVGEAATVQLSHSYPDDVSVRCPHPHSALSPSIQESQELHDYRYCPPLLRHGGNSITSRETVERKSWLQGSKAMCWKDKQKQSPRSCRVMKRRLWTGLQWIAKGPHKAKMYLLNDCSSDLVLTTDSTVGHLSTRSNYWGLTSITPVSLGLKVAIFFFSVHPSM